eukprot:191865_1
MAEKEQEEQVQPSTFETNIIPQKQDEPLLSELSPTKGTTKRSVKYAIILISIALILIAVVFVMIFAFSDLFEAASSLNECKTDRKLIIISLDGFRSEYLQNENISTPNLDYMKETGVHIKRLIPVY